MKNGVWRLGEWWGIPVLLHWTFPFLLLYVAYIGWDTGMSARSTGFLVVFQLTVFGCVVLHEYGHALAARRFGVNTQDIILTPIGGIARLLRIPEKPMHEIIVALAGPAVNVVIIILCGLVVLLTNLPLVPEIESIDIFDEVSNYPSMLLWVNIFLLLFNLVPAFPMDGGRVLRALLAMRFHRAKVTYIAGTIGQIICIGFIGVGVYNRHWSLILIGGFIFMAARQEIISAKRKHRLISTKIGDIVQVDYLTFSPTDPMMLPMSKLSEKGNSDFLVKEEGLIIGVLHEEFIREAKDDNDLYSPVGDYMCTGLEDLSADLSVEQAIRIFQSHPYSILPVKENGILLGVLSRTALNAFV